MARQKKEGNHEDAEKEKYEEIGNRLISIREALGYSVKDMAENLGLNYETYRNYERGISNIPLKVLKALREKFHVNLNYLIAGDGTAFSLKSRFTMGKSYFASKRYFIGNNLKKLRNMLSLSTSEFLSYLDTLDSEAKLIAIENNQVEVDEDLIEDICENFSVIPEWLIGRGLIAFRTRKIDFENLEKICRTEYPAYRPEVLFSVECRNEGDVIYFALFLKGEKPYQGILLYENADFAIWRSRYGAAIELRRSLQFAYLRGMYSVYILDLDTFGELVIGRIHPVKAMEKGTPPSFPFIPALFDEKVRKYILSLKLSGFEEGTSDYGLMGIIRSIEERES